MSHVKRLYLGRCEISFGCDATNWSFDWFADKDLGGDMLRYVAAGPFSLSVYTLPDRTPLFRT